VVLLTRTVGLVRGVRVVLTLVVFLSGAYGRLVLPFPWFADSYVYRPHAFDSRARKGVMLWIIR
jgi:hypothetical protein